MFTRRKRRCLYVGAGNLKERLHSHYRESYDEPKGKAKRWCVFFGARENQGEMRIFYKEMEDRKAEVIEQMLSYVLVPEFENKKFSSKTMPYKRL